MSRSRKSHQKSLEIIENFQTFMDIAPGELVTSVIVYPTILVKPVSWTAQM